MIVIVIVVVIVIICNGSIYSMAWLGLNYWLHLWHDRSIPYQEHTLSPFSSLNSVQFIVLWSSAFYHYSSNVIIYYHFSWQKTFWSQLLRRHHHHWDTITIAYIIIIWISKHLERENKNDVMLSSSSFLLNFLYYIASISSYQASMAAYLKVINLWWFH